MGKADQGKSAEKKVRDYLDLLDKAHVAFTFNRNQDAHAAGGRFVPVAGDFQAFGLYLRKAASVGVSESLPACSRNFILEVKEVQHDFRLPYKNYSADKVARVQKRVLAGAEPLVLIRFMPRDEWRAVPFEVFRNRNEATPSGSWDLSAYPFVDYRKAISDLVGFLP
jgi:hypothetical protein